MKKITGPILLIALLTIASITLHACSQGGGELVVGNIDGPATIDGCSTVDFSIYAKGDTGKAFLWSCDPPYAGSFDPSNSPHTKFTSAELIKDTRVGIRVVVTTGKSGPAIRIREVTILANCGLRVSEIRGSDSLAEGYPALYSVEASGDTGITAEWSCDPPGAFEFLDRNSLQAKTTPLAVVDATQADLSVTVGSDNADPVVRMKTVTITDTSPAAWVRSWDAFHEPVNTQTAIALDQSGYIYVVGSFDDTTDLDPGPGVDEHHATGQSASLSKFDPTGDFIWARTWGGSSDEDVVNAQSIHIDDSGNIYVVGVFNGEGDFDPGPGVDLETITK
jgi:hypothetical protein